MSTHLHSDHTTIFSIGRRRRCSQQSKSRKRVCEHVKIDNFPKRLILYPSVFACSCAYICVQYPRLHPTIANSRHVPFIKHATKPTQRCCTMSIQAPGDRARYTKQYRHVVRRKLPGLSIVEGCYTMEVAIAALAERNCCLCHAASSRKTFGVSVVKCQTKHTRRSRCNQ